MSIHDEVKKLKEAANDKEQDSSGGSSSDTTARSGTSYDPIEQTRPDGDSSSSDSGSSSGSDSSSSDDNTSDTTARSGTSYDPIEQTRPDGDSSSSDSSSSSGSDSSSSDSTARSGTSYDPIEQTRPDGDSSSSDSSSSSGSDSSSSDSTARSGTSYDPIEQTRPSSSSGRTGTNARSGTRSDPDTSGKTTTIDGITYRVSDDGSIEAVSESPSDIPLDNQGQSSNTIDSNGTSDFVGQETATGLGHGDLPQTGVQEFLAPIQKSGREYNRREGEQFGDWDWSIGPFDDLEQGAREFQEDAENFAGDAGEAAGSNTGVPGVLEAAGFEQTADRVDDKAASFARGGGEGVGGLVGGLPVMGMEAAETTGYAATNPKDAARKAPKAVAGSAVATSNQIEENPARALGSITSETLLTAGVGSGAARGARALVKRRRGPDTSDAPSSRSGGSTRSPRTLAGDDRGQMTIGDLVPGKKRGGDRGDSTSSSSSGGDSILPDNIEELKSQMENAHGRRRANERAREKTLEKRLEEGRRQERGDEPRTVDTRPGGDYTSPDGPGGDYVSSRSPDTSRSGPTDAQTSAGRSSLDTDLSPRESQLAAKIGRETPSVDIRGVDATRRSTPSTDLRVASRSDASRTGAMGAAGGGAVSLLEQAQQPQVLVDDEGPSGATEDTGIRGQSDAGDSLGLLDDAQSGSSLEDWLSGVMGTGTGTSTGDGTNTGTTGTGTGTGTSTGVNTNTGTTVDTGSTTDTDGGTKTGGGTETGTGPGPVTPPPTSKTPVPPNGDPPLTPPPTDPPGGKPPKKDPPKRPDSDRDFGLDLSLDTFSSGPTAPRETDGDLTPGWLSETVTTIGTRGMATPDTPSQQTLEEQPASLRLTGELPTSEMLRDDEGVEAAQGLFSFGPAIGGSGSSSSGGSEQGFGLDLGFGSNSDDDEWWLL